MLLSLKNKILLSWHFFVGNLVFFPGCFPDLLFIFYDLQCLCVLSSCELFFYYLSFIWLPVYENLDLAIFLKRILGICLWKIVSFYMLELITVTSLLFGRVLYFTYLLDGVPNNSFSSLILHSAVFNLLLNLTDLWHVFVSCMYCKYHLPLFGFHLHSLSFSLVISSIRRHC